MEAALYCSAFAFAGLAYKGYRSFDVPKEIEWIPEIPIFGFIFSFLSRESFDEQYNRLVREKAEETGLVRIWLRGRWDVVITNVKQAREVLAMSDTFLKRPEGGDPMLKGHLVSKFFGSSNIVTSDGDEWRRHRKVANPSFKKQWDTKMFGKCTLELMEKLTDEPIVIHDLLQRLTLDALGLGMFSYNFGAVNEQESHYLQLYNDIMLGIFDPVYFIFPFLETLIPSRRQSHRNNDEFRHFLSDMIKDRKAQLDLGHDQDDLLSLMIKASGESQVLTDEEVVNDLATFFLAGHDTTANTLTSTLYYLAKHPEIQEKARREVISVLGDNVVTVPTIEQLKEMNYINCIIKESMRLMTTVTQYRRYCNQDVTLSDGLVIPKSCSIVIHSWAIHHDPSIFPNPNEFKPERFLELHGGEDQSWMAFGSGSRMCAGINFSLVEQRVVMAILLQKYTFKLGPQSISREQPLVKSTGLAYPSDMDLVFSPRF